MRLNVSVYFVYFYVHVFVYLYVCAFVYLYVHVFVYLYVCAFVLNCVHVYLQRTFFRWCVWCLICSGKISQFWPPRRLLHELGRTANVVEKTLKSKILDFSDFLIGLQTSPHPS